MNFFCLVKVSSLKDLLSSEIFSLLGKTVTGISKVTFSLLKFYTVIVFTSWLSNIFHGPISTGSPPSLVHRETASSTIDT